MKITKASASLILLLSPSSHNCAAASTDDAIPSLKGATPTTRPDTRFSLKKYNQDYHTRADGLGSTFEASSDIINAANTGYAYGISIDATLPLEVDRFTGKPEIDQCIEWNSDSNPDNFTWYGLRIQLPDDAVTRSGHYFTYVTRATKELGFVQQYNETSPASILKYNITTKDAQPTIRINFNDNPFWETYTFDFVDQGSIVSDNSNYQEFNRKMNGAVSCYTNPSNETWRSIISPVIPTLTISLQRFGGGGGDNTPPPPIEPSAAVAAPHGKLLSLSLAAFGAAWTWSF